MRCLLAVLLLLLGARMATSQQKYAPPPVEMPDADTLKIIVEKTRRLEGALLALRKQGVPDRLLVDIEIYHRAAESMVQLKEFYHKNSATWTLDALDRGMLRARFLAEGEAPWLKLFGQSVPLGYRSRIDGTVQPYGVSYPPSYGKDPQKKWRVDLVLHGRDNSLTEAKFLYAHSGTRPVPADQDFVAVHAFGRGNNAYRWAGETDVFEAIDAFFHLEQVAGRGRLIDPRRVVLRGFSMGGAGTWHLGLQWPGRWCVIGPGAGFTTTHGYTKLPALTPYQEACLRIYDAVDYAENAFDIPIVAYSGDQDPQKQAADNVEKRLRALGLEAKMTHLIAPGLKHEFPAEWFVKANALYAKHGASGRPEYPPQVRFVTYTMKFPGCDWVELLALEKHYVKAEIKGERVAGGFRITTENIRVLRLLLPEGETSAQEVVIDGHKLSARPVANELGAQHVYLEKVAGQWRGVWPQRIMTERARVPQKIHKLQGPIDDAFGERFLCVRGTGKPWHSAPQKLADARLAAFRADWARYWRGNLPVKDDEEVTSEDIAHCHLILFGDPASNSLLTQLVDGLPVRWDREQIRLDTKKYPAAEHLPVLIYPNPLNASRYVVLNSGPTVPRADYQDTNALNFPRLGDFAVLQVTGEGASSFAVAAAGLFDDHWRLPPREKVADTPR